MKACLGIIVTFTIVSALANGADGGCAGNSHWVQKREALQDGYPVADMCSERIPPACVLGVTNTHFRWMPSLGEVALYAYTHDVRPWMTRRFYPFVCKYLPPALKMVVAYQKDKNAVLIAVPVVLKYLHKF